MLISMCAKLSTFERNHNEIPKVKLKANVFKQNYRYYI